MQKQQKHYEVMVEIHDGAGEAKMLVSEWVTWETAHAVGQIVREAIQAAEATK